MLVKAFLLVALVAVAITAPSHLLVGPIDVKQEWTNWKITHSRSYESPEEEQRRFQIFENNTKGILDHNKKFLAGEVSYTLGLNDFADLTHEEFAKGHLGFLPKP